MSREGEAAATRSGSESVSELKEFVKAELERELEKLLIFLDHTSSDDRFIHVIKGGVAGGYIAGLLYALYLERITRPVDFEAALERVFLDLEKEHEAFWRLLNRDLRIAPALEWFVIGFMSAIKNAKKEVSGDGAGAR